MARCSRIFRAIPIRPPHPRPSTLLNFEAKYDEVLAMSESLGLSSTYDSVKIARLAYDMHTNKVNQAEQIELPAIEF